MKSFPDPETVEQGVLGEKGPHNILKVIELDYQGYFKKHTEVKDF